MKKNEKEDLVKQMLIAIGENPDREGLKETPKRVVKMWDEIFRGYNKKELPNIKVFPNGTDGVDADQMVCDTGDFYSHCEHHMVPFIGRYWFSVLYHPKGNILGLSKVARVVDYYAAKLQIQERLGGDITNHLWKALTVKKNGEVMEPIAMGLVIEAEHLCKSMRGVKKKGKMRTVKLLGAFLADKSLKQEFLDWVNNNAN